MEYVPLSAAEHYADCAPVVEGLGFFLVELKIVRSRGSIRVGAVIAPKEPGSGIGVDDCARAHRALLPVLERLLGSDDIYMELTSPGMERNIRNPAEFALFAGRELRVWSREASDWVSGIIAASDEQSVTLEFAQGGTRVFRYEDIAKAKFVHG